MKFWSPDLIDNIIAVICFIGLIGLSVAAGYASYLFFS